MPPQLVPLLSSLSTSFLRARAPRPRFDIFPSGNAALALAHHHLERAFPGRGHAARSATALARATTSLANGAFSPILYGGFTGLAWVAAHLDATRGSALSDPTEDPGADIDAALLEFLDVPEWPVTYDLIGGLVGYGIYALERLPRPSGKALLERVVAHLDGMSERRKPGVTWATRPEWWPPSDRTPSRAGWNLGVAHGVPGVIGLLARAHRAGIARRETARLLEGAVPWLLAQELPRSSPSCFSWSVGTPESGGPSRSAWCYGDPGIAAVLLLAARASGDPAWKRAALRIALRAAKRDPDECGVVDTPLCHGAAGLAHVYNRLAVDTGDERFESAARTWLQRTLAMCTSGPRGTFGGWDLDNARETRVRWTGDVDFLTGSAGVALALAAFRTKKTADWAGWDRILLLSDGPR